MVLKEIRGCLEDLVDKVAEVYAENQELPASEHPAKTVPLEHQDPPGQRENREQTAGTVFPDEMEDQDMEVCVEHQALKVLKEKQGMPDSLAILDTLVAQETPVKEVHQDLVVLPVLTEAQEDLATPGEMATQGHPD